MARREILLQCEIPEVYQLALETDSRGTIAQAHLRGGYTARAIGKLVAERYRDPNQAIFVVERLCGICSHSHTLAFCQAVEVATRVVVPSRAAAIRTLVAELERMQSHTLNLHEVATLVGAQASAKQCWAVREAVTELLVGVTGNRIHYGVNCIGGVTRDVSTANATPRRRWFPQLDEALCELLTVFEQDARANLEGLGIWAPEPEEGAGTGPNGRACGLANDIRAVSPYAAYGTSVLSPVLEQGGDAWSRTRVRLRELRTSLAIVKDRLSGLPEGRLRAEEIPPLAAAVAGTSTVEAPRGANEHRIVLSRAGEIESLEIGVPTPRTIPSLERALRGEPQDKAQVVVASFDLCMSCADGTS